MNEVELDEDCAVWVAFLKRPQFVFDMSSCYPRSRRKSLGLGSDKVVMVLSEIGLTAFYLVYDIPVAISYLKAVKDEGLRIIKLEYAVLPAHRGRGYCEILTRLAISEFEKVDNFNLIEADIEPDNLASINMAKKLSLSLARQYTFNQISYLVYMRKV
jgi:hypothetical protein